MPVCGGSREKASQPAEGCEHSHYRARDPKQAWADAPPEFYPVDVNKAEREALFRVPGLGPAAVSLILRLRREGRIPRIEALGIKGVRAEKIKRYTIFE